MYLIRRYLIQPKGKDHEPSSLLSRSIMPILLITFGLLCYIFFVGVNATNNENNGNTLSASLLGMDGAVQLEYMRKRLENVETGVKNEIESILSSSTHSDPPMEISQESEPQNINSFHSGCLRTIPEVDHGPHIVNPPEGSVTLVCCVTTAGVLNIAVHPTWAPIGVENFLNMVKTKFFSSEVALFRALSDFLIQYGLAGDPDVQENYERTKSGGDPYLNLPDDPQWLPQGPPGRNIDGVPRYQKGYLSYAGGGPNTRGTQLFITNADSLYLGGGSPWEVPLGQLVGDESFKTIDNVYTGYGEAPSQGKIRNRGNSYLKAEFPKLDYILSCDIMAEELPWRYEPIKVE